MERQISGPVRGVLERLKGVKAKINGNGWEALCPHHDDQHRSLGVGVGSEGQVLLSCGKGCEVRDIVRALGLTMRDLWPQPDDDLPPPSRPASGKPVITATYDYRDEAGCVLFQVCRLEPGPDGARKTFRQRRRVADGWAWTMAGGTFRRRPDGDWQRQDDGAEIGPADRHLLPVPTVLYRLPELLAAPPDRPVFIPEGEKDVEALLAVGLVATTNPMGAGKWRDHYPQALGGRRVIVLPDNDEPGRRHADQVARSLQGTASSVQVLPLPGLPMKGDVSDWLAAGGTAEQLLALASAGNTAFPEPVPSSRLRRADPANLWLWRGIIARGEITLFSALWKAGKTTLLSHLYRVFEHGGEFCGLPVLPARVLVVTEEQESRWAQRRDEIGLADHLEFLIRPFPGRPRTDRWEEFVAHLRKLQAQRGYDLIVFDTLANLWPVRDENDAAGVQTALMPLHALTDHAALHLVHHARKSDGQEATSSRGSGALTAFVDTIIEFRRFNASDRKDRKRVLTGYGRHDETPDELVIELTPDGYRGCGGDRERVAGADVAQTIQGILPHSPPGLTADQILDLWPSETQPARGRFYAALKRGVEDGPWLVAGEGKKGSPFTYWLPLREEAL